MTEVLNEVIEELNMSALKNAGLPYAHLVQKHQTHAHCVRVRSQN